MMDGKPWKLCKKCNMWRTGEKAHTKSEHARRSSDTQDKGTGHYYLAQVNQSIETRSLRINPNLFGYSSNLHMKGGLFVANRGDSRDSDVVNQDIMDASYNELQELRRRSCLEDDKYSVLTKCSEWLRSSREENSQTEKQKVEPVMYEKK